VAGIAGGKPSSVIRLETSLLESPLCIHLVLFIAARKVLSPTTSCLAPGRTYEHVMESLLSLFRLSLIEWAESHVEQSPGLVTTSLADTQERLQ
jgi:hypothetical protein